MVPIGLIVGTYAWIAGANVVSLNDQYVHGFTALITAIGLTFFLSYIFGTFWAIVQWIGFLIYSHFKSIRLRYCETNQSYKNLKSSESSIR